MLDFDESGALDVHRLNAQQVARLDSMVASVLGASKGVSGVVEASSSFLARGGTWEPSPQLRRQLDSAAMGALPCRRVRVIE